MIRVQKKVELESKYLTSNVEDHLFRKIRQEYEGKCTEDYGYITKVFRMVDYKSNYISRANRGNIFVVDFEVEALKPDVDLELEGKIKMIFHYGLFVEVKMLKVLISLNQMDGYKYESSKTCFVKGDQTLEVGDTVKLKITGVEYERNSFNCIGSLKEEEE